MAAGDASLNSIAKKVGAGTLYRHFPNREALVLAVYRALWLWFDRLAHYGTG
ncbi:TetR family transcriptional regulator [Sphaerisporangium perillae]|uniref:TetR family transcriptional regulator n=1 Tax=Sphaerisporangium perillae TaxID=2935860 RepID=UPI00355781D0